MNWYGYAGGDPVNATDPSGLAAQSTVGNNLHCKDLGEDPTHQCDDIIITGARMRGGINLLNYPIEWGYGPISYRPGQGAIGYGGSPSPQTFDRSDSYSLQSRESTFDKFKACAAAQYGFGDGKTKTGLDLGKIGSEIGSLPVFKPLAGIFVTEGASNFTNVLNYTSLKLGLNARFEGAALRTFTKAVFGSVRIATVVGRANVIIGGALLAYDAASIAICTSRK